MPPRERYGPGRAGWTAVLVAVVCLLAGCRLSATVEVEVREGGSGSVSAAVGLDDDALERLGDPDAQVVVDDLRATGWQVAPAAKEADGLTWLRASKPFATVEEATAILGELTGPQGAFREFSVTTEEGLGRTTWALRGTVDLSKGYESFTDAELRAALDGDAFGGQLTAIEQAEGRPIADMTDLKVVVRMPNAEPVTFTPRVGDPTPTQVEATGSRTISLPLPLGGTGGGGLAWMAGAGVVLLGVLLLGALRRRFRAVGR